MLSTLKQADAELRKMIDRLKQEETASEVPAAEVAPDEPDRLGLAGLNGRRLQRPSHVQRPPGVVNLRVMGRPAEQAQTQFGWDGFDVHVLPGPYPSPTGRQAVIAGGSVLMSAWLDWRRPTTC
ncbi:MAG: hypothetical protein SWK90_03925 [Chloroflexota bacterium]|nr:hypothetical protein [Chloroflexota bacterium]